MCSYSNSHLFPYSGRIGGWINIFTKHCLACPQTNNTVPLTYDWNQYTILHKVQWNLSTLVQIVLQLLCLMTISILKQQRNQSCSVSEYCALEFESVGGPSGSRISYFLTTKQRSAMQVDGTRMDDKKQ